MKRALWLATFLLLAAPGLTAAEQLFDIKPVVPGVWAAIAKEQFKINCNAAIIELDDGLLVVDTHSKPSAARALIEQIKTVSPKPVKFVVNTHFHWDHYQGNQAYPAAWPQGLEIISSEATRENIERRGIPRMKHEVIAVPKDIEKLKADLEKAIGPEQRAQIGENLRQAEAYLEELKAMQVTLPTITFDRSMIIHRKSRSVQLLWLGRAHTDGDIFVYLPKERVIATGDALQGWLPYMGDGFPYDWIKTLDAAEKLEFDYTIGGHGEVLRGKAQFELWKTYISDLMATTAEAYASGATMKDAEMSVAAKLKPQYASKFPAGMFDTSVVANIQKAYRVVSALTE